MQLSIQINVVTLHKVVGNNTTANALRNQSKRLYQYNVLQSQKKSECSDNSFTVHSNDKYSFEYLLTGRHLTQHTDGYGSVCCTSIFCCD